MIETINQIMILCGWITTVGGAIVVLTGAWKKFKKPERDLEKRMQTIEEDIKDIKSKLEKDYTSIRTQRDDMNTADVAEMAVTCCDEHKRAVRTRSSEPVRCIPAGDELSE